MVDYQYLDWHSPEFQRQSQLLRDGRWCIVDRVGKHGRIRTMPVPSWVKTIDAWPPRSGDVEDWFSDRKVLVPVR